MHQYPISGKQFYLDIIENAAEGILIAEVETRKFIFGNRTICEMFGYTEEEIVTLSVDAIHPKKQLDQVKAAFDAQARRQFKLATDLPCLRKDGSVFYANISTAPVELEDVKYNIGFFTDTTELHEKKRELEGAKADLESIFRGIPYPTVVLDRHHNIIEANRAAIEAIGKPLAECQQRKCWHLMHGPDHNGPPPNCPFEKVLETGVVQTEEMEAHGGYYIVSCTPQFDDAGQIEKVIHTATDITSRKKIEEQLKLSEMKYANIVGSIGDALFIHDFQGVILDVNEQACVGLGYSREELVGANLSLIDCEEDVEKIASRMEYLKNHEKILFEAEHIHKDGTPIQVQVSASIVERDARGAVLGIARDITQLRQTEEKLRIAQKLESLGVVAGGIAHDFNNLLAAIMGNIEVAQGKIHDDTDALVFLDRAIQAFERATDLTGRLLTFAKGGEPRKEIVSIDDILEESSALALSGSTVSCELKLDGELDNVMADPHQLSQVFNNILINSWQAMPEGGSISVSAQNVFVRSENDSGLLEGNYVKIVIADQGTGIPGEHLEKVFDPFFSTKKMGSGLGLATSYSIIRKHGGAIGISSANHGGAVVTIHLPASRDEVVVELATRLPSSTLSGRVLVMDDEPMILEVCEEILTQLGFLVRCASDGDQAVRIVKEELEKGNRFRFVFLDLTVPGGRGGVPAKKEIRKIDPDIQGIVTSGYADDPVLSSPESYGFSAKIAKPFRKSEFKDIVMELGETTADFERSN